MPHTKRSLKFKKEIDEIIEVLQEFEDLELGKLSPLEELRGARMRTATKVSRLVEILRKNTTDSACVVKASDDEPIFTLRGQDLYAEACVEYWAWRFYMDHADREVHGGLPEAFANMRKHKDARDCAEEMRRYPRHKRPD